MIRAFLFLICSLLCVKEVLAQREIKDSLLSVLEKGAIGPVKVDALNELAYQFYDYDDSIAFVYARQALEEATKISYPKGVKYAYTLIALGYASRGDYQNATINYRRSHTIKATDADGITVYNLTLLANLYRDRGMFDSASLLYNQARSNFGGSELHRLGTIYKNIAVLKVSLWKNEEAIAYLDSASFILKGNPDVYTKLDVWSSYGRAYKNLLQFKKSSEYFDSMCNAAADLEDYFHQIKCLVNKTQLAYEKGEYPTAIRHGINALSLLDKYAYPPQQVEVMQEVGSVYIGLGEYDVATRYLLQALRLADKHGLQDEIATIYNTLAWIYKDQGNYTMALEYLDRAQDIREAIDDQYGIASCQNIRGLVFYLQKKYQASLDEHEKARKIRTSINHPLGVAASIFNMSLVYIDLNQIDKALDLQFKAVEIEEKIDSKQGLAISYNSIASLLIKTKKLDEAEKYLKNSRALAIQTKSRLLKRNNAGYFADLYEAKGDYKRAVEFRKLYQQLNDSIYSEGGVVKMAEMQALYQLEKKDQEIQLLSKEKALQESQLKIQESNLRLQLIIIVSGVVCLILLSVVAINIYRNSKKTRKLSMAISEQNEEIQAQAEELSESNQALTNLNAEIIEKNEEIQAQTEELIEANQSIAEINKSLEDKVDERTLELKQAYKELDTFFYRASHDFRRPLTTFMGLAEVAKITIKDQNALELFSKVNDTAHYLDKMLVKLQSISDVGGQDLVYKEAFLKEIFDNVCDAFREDLQRKNVRTFCEIELKESFYSYPALLRIIIENLVENSIFFSRANDPMIWLRVYARGREVIIELQDNGEGIPVEFQERIFEMYFRANERSKGNGLGLYIVKKAIEKLNGVITLKSELNKGTTFVISFLVKTP